MIVDYDQHHAPHHEVVEDMQGAVAFLERLEDNGEGYATRIREEGRVLWERAVEHGPGLGWHQRADDAPPIPEGCEVMKVWEPPPPRPPLAPMPTRCPECGALTVRVDMEQVIYSRGWAEAPIWMPGPRIATCENGHTYGPVREVTASAGLRYPPAPLDRRDPWDADG
jgi:hypothetical protein